MKQTLKKSVSILLSLIMVFSLFTIVPLSASAASVNLTDFLPVSSSGTATGYSTYDNHFYKIEWSGINTSETSSVKLYIATYDNPYAQRLNCSRNDDVFSSVSLYENASISYPYPYWEPSHITNLAPGQSSYGYTIYEKLGKNANSDYYPPVSQKVCTVTCMAANTPTWNWAADGLSCTATFTCSANSSLTATVNANVTTSGNTATASVTFNGTSYTDTKSIVTQDGDTYTIHNAAGWNVFCDMLADSDKGVFTGKTVKLADDITVTRMAGSSYHDFTGTFNGQGHTLTFNSTDAVDYCAPFRYTEGTPVFRDLIIDGTINTSGAYAAGLIGHLYGNVSIERCTSRVEITSNGNSGGFVGLCEQEVAFTDCVSSAVIHCNAGNNSGFVGWSRSSKYTISFEGCVFNGKLLKNDGTGYNGGFIGWKGDAKTVTVTNCLYAPAALVEGEAFADSNSATFSREHSNYAATITNCYYTRTLGTAQGKQVYTISAGESVKLAPSGTAKTYTVSGITAYENNNGLLYGDTFYAGNGDSVSLTLGNTTPTGYAFAGYTVTAGTLEGTENPYTLTMPDSDVTVNAALDLIGDANRDGEVNVNDVTAIQRHLADVEVIPERFLVLADTDGNGEVNISDATRLQMYIAHYDIALG